MEGYPHEAVKISYEKTKQAFVKNSGCFPAVVSVNGKDLSVKAGEEMGLETESWGHWKWHPGSIGSMAEREVPWPLKDVSKVSFGPGFGTHTSEHQYSYDFSVPQGTPVYAMESGVVIRIVQHYSIAHQNKTQMDQVNKVEILHADGSFASYVHLKPQSVTLRLCETVSAGALVGLSGHNGYSTGPHLHVDVIRPIGRGNFMTIPLKFLSK
jgi:murein DD-endopeptidase MepM/ murein hydrolase activator NlpD